MSDTPIYDAMLDAINKVWKESLDGFAHIDDLEVMARIAGNLGPERQASEIRKRADRECDCLSNRRTEHPSLPAIPEGSRNTTGSVAQLLGPHHGHPHRR